MFNGCGYVRDDMEMRNLYLTVCNFSGKYLVTGHRTSGTWNDTKMGTRTGKAYYGEVFSATTIRTVLRAFARRFMAGLFTQSVVWG